MKTSHYLFLIFIAAFIAINGCKKNNDNSRTVTLDIGSKVTFTGAAPPSSLNYDSVPCMNVKEEETGNSYMLYVKRIDGFDFVEGYKYRIRVLISPIKNPPADGYTETYTLIEILSKTKE